MWPPSALTSTSRKDGVQMTYLVPEIIVGHHLACWLPPWWKSFYLGFPSLAGMFVAAVLVCVLGCACRCCSTCRNLRAWLFFCSTEEFSYTFPDCNWKHHQNGCLVFFLSTVPFLKLSRNYEWSMFPSESCICFRWLVMCV